MKTRVTYSIFRKGINDTYVPCVRHLYSYDEALAFAMDMHRGDEEKWHVDVKGNNIVYTFGFTKREYTIKGDNELTYEGVKLIHDDGREGIIEKAYEEEWDEDGDKVAFRVKFGEEVKHVKSKDVDTLKCEVFPEDMCEDYNSLDYMDWIDEFQYINNDGLEMGFKVIKTDGGFDIDITSSSLHINGEEFYLVIENTEHVKDFLRKKMLEL